MKVGCIVWSQDVLCDNGDFANQWKTVCEEYSLQGQASPIALAKGDTEMAPICWHWKLAMYVSSQMAFTGIDFIGVVKPWLYKFNP